jgi:hypothetical protein
MHHMLSLAKRSVAHVPRRQKSAAEKKKHLFAVRKLCKASILAVLPIAHNSF